MQRSDCPSHRHFSFALRHDAHARRRGAVGSQAMRSRVHLAQLVSGGPALRSAGFVSEQLHLAFWQALQARRSTIGVGSPGSMALGPRRWAATAVGLAAAGPVGARVSRGLTRCRVGLSRHAAESRFSNSHSQKAASHSQSLGTAGMSMVGASICGGAVEPAVAPARQRPTLMLSSDRVPPRPFRVTRKCDCK
jgi:hypothetical protein